MLPCFCLCRSKPPQNELVLDSGYGSESGSASRGRASGAVPVVKPVLGPGGKPVEGGSEEGPGGQGLGPGGSVVSSVLAWGAGTASSAPWAERIMGWFINH